LVSWFKAIQLHSLPEGINALQLSTTIGVTYKTAWLICHKIRHAMSLAESRNLLTGWIKVSNAILSQQAAAKFAWSPQEQSLLIAASRDQGGILQIKMEKQNKELLRHKYALPDTRSFVRRVVAPESIRTVRVAGLISSNRNQKLILLVRQAGRQLARQFRGIGPKHLQVYLNQLCYVRNRQNISLFNLLLLHCAQSLTITYPMLIGRASIGVSRRVSPRSRSVTKLSV
jgi:hypothetical protein